MNPTLSRAALCALSLSPFVAAQQLNPVAYPQNTEVAGDSGNCAPLGQDSSDPRCDEGRVHLVVPAEHLPSTGGAIAAIDVLIPNSRTIEYEILDINLDHFTGGLLSPTFADNLTSPTQVLSLSNQTLSFTGGAWSRINFAQPFDYNGQDDLVIEFRKRLSLTQIATATVGAFHRVPLQPRTFLQRMQVSLGAYNSGALDAPTSAGFSAPLTLRAVFLDVPTMTVTGDPGGVFNSPFGIGSDIVLETHGSPGDQAAQVLDLSGMGFNPSPLAIPFVNGRDYVNLLSPLTIVLPATVIPPSGVVSNTITIPADPSLAGQPWVFQSLVITGGALSWTSATEAFVRF